LRVVAQFRVRIERQMIGQQVDVVSQQSGQALTPDTGHAAILALPEIAMVHQDGIGISGHCSIQQRLAGRDTGNQANDLGRVLPLADRLGNNPGTFGHQSPSR
jgi:hypothetical protein